MKSNKNMGSNKKDAVTSYSIQKNLRLWKNCWGERNLNENTTLN